MRNLSINNVEDLFLSPLLVELTNDIVRNINDLNDGHALEMTRSNLEVLFFDLGGIVSIDQFEYGVTLISFHDFAQRETMLHQMTGQNSIFFRLIKINLLK